jgi:fructokinase
MNHPRRYDVLCVGEALIDLLPSVIGPLESVPTFVRHAGGAPANVAIGVARLGGRCAFAGTVGDDPFGRFLQQYLAQEGVDVSNVHAVEGHRTGIAFVSLNDAGQPRFFSAGKGGAELALADAHLASAPIEECAFLCLGTYVLASPTVREAMLNVLDRARMAGVRVALDPNLRLHLWREPEVLQTLLPRLLSLSDVVKLSSDECEFVTRATRPDEAARRVLDHGPRLAVVTAGGDGCYFAQRSASGVQSGRVPTRAVHVTDSTGAGDGFMAVLVTALATLVRHGVDWTRLAADELIPILRAANEAGARVCEHVGAIDGLPRSGSFGPVVVQQVRVL